jgi:Tol biopolymer transport system component/DNA-binding winged helix-turn-helix (wHTH) protein
MPGSFFVFRFADVEVREREFSISKAGQVLPVEPKAFRVLLMLLRNPQKLIAKEEFLNAVWGDAAVTENSLARSIALLRRLLGDDTQSPRYIETVATVGYRWVCKVEVAEEPSGVPEAPAEPVEAHGQIDSSESRKRVRGWVLAGGGVLAFCLAGTIWYLHRPLPPPRITAYTRITNDGHKKYVTATDGSRLYFAQMQPNSINQVGVAGGEVAQIPVALPGFFWTGDISPDGSNLLVASREANSGEISVWIVRVLGGTSRLIGHNISAAFSPDGNTIVYTTDPGDIWLAQSDGTGGHKVASPGQNIGTVGWSPDGNTIVYTTSQGELWLTQTDGTGDHKLASIGPDAGFLHWSPDGKVFRFMRDGALWEISANGSSLHQMLPGWQHQGGMCCGGWTADGKFYIFVTELRADGGGTIWALDERRGLFRHPSAEPVQLTTGPINWNAPVPGKGMNRIFSAGETARVELYRFDPKTKQLQPFLGGISAQDVSFSRDGQFVAYVSFPDDILWKANRDGSNPVQLSTAAMHPANPRWSPDGSKILFGDYEERDSNRIYLVSSQGAVPERLPAYRGNQDDPTWSADGRKIVFASSGADGKENNLAVLDLATGQATPVPGSDGLYSPRWSPDGKLIAAMSTKVHGLKVLDVSTRRWSTLPVSNAMGYPAWSSDARYIYFSLRENGDPGVYRSRATGGKVERVVDLKDWPIMGLSSFWSALDPTDAPLLQRDAGTDDIYALTLEEK